MLIHPIFWFFHEIKACWTSGLPWTVSPILQKNLAAGKSNGSLNFKHTKCLILWNWTNLLNTKILVHHMHRQVVLKVRELHQIFDSTQAWGGYMDGFKYIINLLMNVPWSSWNCFPIWISSYNFSLGFINESLPKTTQWAAFTLYQQGASAWTPMVFWIKVRLFYFIKQVFSLILESGTGPNFIDISWKLLLVALIYCTIWWIQR